MGFEEEHVLFLDRHLSERTGERKRRLKEGHGQAEKLFLEKVWWPLFHHFDHLHPEYEVNDFKDGTRYLDFAYIRPSIKICFEIDGYGPHLRNVSRWQFADSLERQNQLIIDGWTVIRFSYDQLVDQPRRCQQVCQQVIGRMLGDEWNHLSLSSAEKEVMRYALRKGDSFTPGELISWLGLSDRTIRKILIEMVRKKVLTSAGGRVRIRSYRLCEGIRTPFFQK